MLRKSILKYPNRVLNELKRRYSNRNILKLKDRGMFQELFPDISAREVTDLLNSKPQTVYAGFDPTADSLHVGNLLIVVNLIHWQRGGHNVIALLGGATGKIGDPSGRTTERDELLSVYVDENLKGIRKNIEDVFENHEKLLWNGQDPLPKVRILNNEEWYSKISPVQLIGHVGRYLRMGTLLGRTSVQTRLASPAGMSFTEFSYQLFQAYDWLQLNREFGCRFQIGGSDQMGNIMSGHDLISRIQKQSVYGLTLPLVTSETGDKFGKSAGNAVWITNDKTSPFTFYQFWVRQPDGEVEKFLKLFTFDTNGSIEDLMRRHKEKPELRLAQKRLAEQVTLLVHGTEGLRQAEIATKALYEGSVSAMGTLTVEEIARIFQGADIVEVLPEPGQTVMDLAMRAKCFPTNNDAVRIISAGGFYVNQQRVSNPSEVLNPPVHRLSNNVTLLRVGKRNNYIIKWV